MIDLGLDTLMLSRIQFAANISFAYFISYYHYSAVLVFTVF